MMVQPIYIKPGIHLQLNAGTLCADHDFLLLLLYPPGKR